MNTRTTNSTVPRFTDVPPDAQAGQEAPDLEQVLQAWYAATERLRETHEVLGHEVRRLTAELEVKNRELARKNRLEDLGRMASHVAHEVRNGMAPVTLYLSLLRRRVSEDPAALRMLDNMEAALTALEATVSDLLSFTVDRDPLWQQFSLRPLVEEVLEALAPQLDAQDIRCELSVDPSLQLSADRDMMRRAVLNLVLNALDVMPQGGELVITACRTVQGIDLEVADSGPGIDRSLQNRLFEPFFTTKTEGTGLGLAIVYRIAEAHGGRVTVMNCPEGGAAFTIHIPRRVLEAAA